MSIDLEQRVAAIEARNERVQFDKAWEISRTRKVLILVATYFIVLAYNWAIGGRNPVLTAFVPTAGFWLSTLTFPVIKRRWIARRR